MTAIDSLIHRYLDDRQGLAEDEIDALVAGLRADPARAIELREQLLLDDLVSQKLAGDRLNFLAQVGQRIADFERGEEEIDSHVVELRAMAEGEILAPPPQTRGWLKYAAALAITLLLLVAVSSLLWAPRSSLPVAKVLSSSGDVVLRQASGESTLAAGASVLAGQEIITPAGGHVMLQYADNTSVEIRGGSQVKLSGEGPAGSKRVVLDRGQLVAEVAPQPEGAPMTFVTPHAEAIVLGTRLSLTVTAHDTVLDVTEGQVRLNRLVDEQSVVVASQESALATAELLQLRELRWPSTRDTIVYACEPFGLTSLARNPDTGNLRDTPLTSVGSAAQNEFTGALELTGGYFISADAGTDLLKTMADAEELTLEIVFVPTSEPQTGTIIALVERDANANFALRQTGDRLQLAIATDGQAGLATIELPLPAQRPEQRPLHVTFMFGNGESATYVDGKHIQQGTMTGRPAGWSEGPLTIGADAQGGNHWQGTILGLAIHKRRLSPSEIERHVRDFATLSGLSE